MDLIYTFSGLFVSDLALYYIINKYIFKEPRIHYMFSLKQWIQYNILFYIIFTFMIYGYIGSISNSITSLPIIHQIISIPLYYILVDTFFYWIHILFHSVDYLYKSHYTHHKYRPITSWDARNLDGLDGTLETLSFIFPGFCINYSFSLFCILLLSNYFWASFLHHSQYEFKINKYVMSNSDHTLHHKYGQKNYNYGFYFTLWDKLMGTYKFKLKDKEFT